LLFKFKNVALFCRGGSNDESTFAGGLARHVNDSMRVSCVQYRDRMLLLHRPEHNLSLSTSNKLLVVKPAACSDLVRAKLTFNDGECAKISHLK
jgi:hypothetical protein